MLESFEVFGAFLVSVLDRAAAPRAGKQSAPHTTAGIVDERALSHFEASYATMRLLRSNLLF